MKALPAAALLLIGCAHAPPATVAPRFAVVVGEPIAVTETRPFGRPTRLLLPLPDVPAAIDAAGLFAIAERRTFVDSPMRVLPFSEPVVDVVLAAAPSGQLACALTRSGDVECVLVARAGTASLPARHFRLPPRTGETHIGFASAPPDALGFPTAVLCRLADSPDHPRVADCWQLDGQAMHLESVALEATAAELAALRLDPENAAAWRAVVPHLTPDKVLQVAASIARDDAHVLAPGTSASVACARIASDGQRAAGRLWCVGAGAYGELGDGAVSTTPRASQPLGDLSVVDIAMARHVACAVVDDGRVACWGALPADLPVPSGQSITRVPMCPLDRAASNDQFLRLRAEHVRAADVCRNACERSNDLDACFACAERCTEVPYIFRHDIMCQEPVGLRQALTQRAGACLPPGRGPQWLTDGELQELTIDESITLSPVFLDGIDDAVSVVLPGRPSLCVAHRNGPLTCTQN